MVTTDGVNMFTVNLAQTTAEATSLTALQATILLTPYPSGSQEHVRRLSARKCFTTENNHYYWHRTTAAAVGEANLETN